MDTELLRKLGNLDQIAGIRESRLLCGRGEGIRLAEFYTAAGLRFSVVPDRCMDLYDLSYKGVNLAFHSKNGLTSAQLSSAMDGEFFEQWPGGAMVTCGLDNVGGPCAADGCTYPTHGRIGSTPASSFGTESFWQDGRYVLQASGEIHQTRLYGRHLSIRRTIETGLQEKTIRIHDVITNFETHDEPYMLLYHCNFGYPLLQADSVVETSRCKQSPMNEISFDPAHMTEPTDDREEELFFRTGFGPEAVGMLVNERLGLGAYVRFKTQNLPNMLQWKLMRAHDYVLAFEPCNSFDDSRVDAMRRGQIAILPAYSSVETELEIGVLDGPEEIGAMRARLNQPEQGEPV